MAYYSKYKGAELEERLDKVEEIPQLIAQMITGKDFVTKEDLLCVLKDYAPADYRTIPIDNNTIYWENGVLKAATSEGGQCQWELREHNGIQYLYSRLPVVTQYDVTMYADVNHLDLPSIYDGLPIDGDTIYWEETEDGKVLKAKSVGGSGENIDAGWVISVISNAGFATQNWVNSQNFISSSLLYTELAKYVKIKDYQEIEGVKNFLNGLQIAGLPITKLNGYEDVIYIDANVVVRGGLTMYYEEGEIDLPTIKDEIGNAGYDGVTGLASFNSSQFFISNDGTVTIIGGSTGLDTAQLKEYLDSNKYTTETWVKEQSYASASSLSSLQTKVNNFLEGSDTDTIINKWKELEVFLSGLSESDNLATILSTKWTTDNNLINQWNTAYGWGDHSKVGYALKSYVDNTFVTIAGNEDVIGIHNFVNGLKIGGVKLSRTTDDIIYLEGNLVVRGGVTMYALDDATVDSIIDALPLASTSELGVAKFNPSNFIINEDGFVTIISGSGGLDTEGLEHYLTINKYATQDWVEDKGYITSSALNGYATQSWVTNQKYITGITSAMVVAALGYTPFNNASFTKANIKSTLGISDWALASSKPSYTTKEVSEDTNLYFTNQRAIDALASTLKSYATDTELSSGLATKADKTINISAGTGLTGGGTLAANRTLSLATSGVSAGTYKSVTVDTYGRVTAGSNPTTLAGYGITDAYTKTQVNNTFALYIPIAGYTNVTGEKNFTGGLRVNNSPSIYYDATNKYWKLEGDLLVTGGVTMYGTDEGDIPSILDSLPIANANTQDKASKGIASFDSAYFKVTDGWVTLTSAPSSVSILGKLQDVSPSVSGTTNSDVVLFKSANSSTWTTKPLSEIGGNGGSVSGNYLPLSGGTISGTSTYPLVVNTTDAQSGIQFLSNNDLLGVIINGGDYGTALINFKGKYRALGIDNDGNAYTTIDYSNTKANLLHTYNYSSYALPLSGGTLTASVAPQLKIVNNGNTDAYITMTGSNGYSAHAGMVKLPTTGDAASFGYSERIVFPVTGGMYYRNGYNGDNQVILHAGNYSSYALPLSGGTLTGKVITWSDLIHVYASSGSANAYISYYSNDGSTYYGDLGFYNDGSPAIWTSSTKWKKLIHEGNISSYNAGSATKLQTARTIWGQSFDGTGNVSGNLTIQDSNIIAESSNSYGSSAWRLFAYGPTYQIYYGLDSSSYKGWLLKLNADDGSFDAIKMRISGISDDRYTEYAESGIKCYSTTSGGYSVGVSVSDAKNSWSYPIANAYGDGSTLKYIYFGGTYNAPWMCINPNGNVGIGTPSPSEKLQVEGNCWLKNGRLCALYASFDGISSITDRVNYNAARIGTFDRTEGGFVIQLGKHDVSNAAWRQQFSIINSGWTETLFSVDRSGNVTANGGITMYSDIRKKTKLQDVELSLSQIANAPLIQHYYNSDQNKTTHVGSIAQYWAGLNDWFCKLDNEGYYTMEIQNCALASAISIARHLEKYESKTDKKIRQLKKRISQLEDELELLKKGV